MAPIAVIPLIDKPQREYHLSCRAPNKQQWRNRLVMEEAPDERRNVMQHHSECEEGQRDNDNPSHKRNFMPHPFDVEVPYINVIRYNLSEDNGKVIAQPSVYKQQNTSCQTAYPVGVRRDNFLRFLRENPLDKHPRREETLRQEAYGIDI